jgi:hypothetical protein
VWLLGKRFYDLARQSSRSADVHRLGAISALVTKKREAISPAAVAEGLAVEGERLPRSPVSLAELNLAEKLRQRQGIGAKSGAVEDSNLIRSSSRTWFTRAEYCSR